MSKENSAARRMADVDNVMESLRKRVAELQSKLEAEMATAAQLPDALDQVQTNSKYAEPLLNLHLHFQVSEATDRCEQLREALAKCESRLGAALEQVAAEGVLLVMIAFQHLRQVAELQEKAKGVCSPAPAVAHKTSSSPSSSILRTRFNLLQQTCAGMHFCLH